MNTTNDKKHPSLFWTPSKGYAARPSKFGVDFVILHYTWSKYPGDLNYLARSPRPSCPSCHFYLRNNGDLHFMVRLDNMAYHAGIRRILAPRRWARIKPNERSIGIEIEGYGEYTEEQYQALEWLLPLLLKRYDIPLTLPPDPYRGCNPKLKSDRYAIEFLENFRGILAHGNIHGSKTDPGMNFDWDRIKRMPPAPKALTLSLPQLIIYRGDPSLLKDKGMHYA